MTEKISPTLKKVVFHSFKGGVGRTLALANYGCALARMGKKVVMLDLDFDAPGLQQKFPMVDSENLEAVSGYVEYLREFFEPSVGFQNANIGSLKSLSSEARIKERAEHIRQNIRIKTDHLALRMNPDYVKNIFIIPAGNSFDARYWWSLASDWFQQLFALNRNQLDGYLYGDKLKVARENEKFFEEELKVFLEVAKDNDAELVDDVYLLIDSKSGREHSVYPILLWADVIVSIFPTNLEGTENLKYQLEFLNKAVGLTKMPVIIPVLARLPHNISQEESSDIEKFQELINVGKSVKNPISDLIVSMKNEGKLRDLNYLNEFRPLEGKEELIVDASDDNCLENDKDGRNWPLGAGYFRLFREIEKVLQEKFPQEGCSREDIVQQLTSIGLVEYPRYFDVEMIRLGGRLINQGDSSRNVALRTRTLQIWLQALITGLLKNGNDMKNSVTDSGYAEETIIVGAEVEMIKTLKKNFYLAGKQTGADFGGDVTKNEGPIKEEKSVGKRLEFWALFDKNVGFGEIRASEVGDSRIRVEWKDNFLLAESRNRTEEMPTKGFEGKAENKESTSGELSEQTKIIMCEFVRGYLKGVLDHLVQPKKKNCMEVYIIGDSYELYGYSERGDARIVEQKGCA